jgi:hypothetical protein
VLSAALGRDGKLTNREEVTRMHLRRTTQYATRKLSYIHTRPRRDKERLRMNSKRMIVLVLVSALALVVLLLAGTGA